jgi:hypothetical protein
VDALDKRLNASEGEAVILYARARAMVIATAATSDFLPRLVRLR